VAGFLRTLFKMAPKTVCIIGTSSTNLNSFMH
jgi:hypothetical protein